MTAQGVSGQCVVSGDGTGELLVAHVGLSFWGGVDPDTGLVIDQHHPLCGQCVSGKVLALPSGRGSCSGSGVMLELLVNELAPAAIVFCENEDIVSLGVIIAETMFDASLPVIQINKADFAELQSGMFARVNQDRLSVSSSPIPLGLDDGAASAAEPIDVHALGIALNDLDREMLAGERGKAAQVAMQVLLRMGAIHNASELLDVSQGHIDACVYNGKSSLMFAQRLASWGANVRVPTTLNALSVDRRCWKEQGVEPGFGQAASDLGQAYLDIGAAPSFTCAPYLLDSTPVMGEQIVWAESNAVAYANSVIGARTQKYPDFLDALIAITGRAPAIGAHADAGRLATVTVQVVAPPDADDAFWPLLGYHVGALCSNDIPLMMGLENSAPDLDDLKAFSAAFATTSAAPMFHILGVTPEAAWAHEHLQSGSKASPDVPAIESLSVTASDLLRSWRELNSARTEQVDLICIGNPHCSLSECATLARLCAGRRKHDQVGVLITLGRAVFAEAQRAGYVASLEAFGARFINDTCWCMITEPIIPADSRNLMTNSGKYAHYGPGLVNRAMHFGSLQACIDAACTARQSLGDPDWLLGE